MEKLTKDQVQKEAFDAWVSNKCVGKMIGATGVGKSKLGLMAIEHAFAQDGEDTDIVLVAPFVKVLTVNWPEEFQNWGLTHLWKYVTPVTYLSLPKLPKKRRSLILLDELHHLTHNASKFFQDNAQPRILGLTATLPKENSYSGTNSNAAIINRLLPTVYKISLREAVEHGLVADYKIWLVNCFLDAKDKYIKSGSKAKPYFTTEMTAYTYINRQIRKAAAMNNHAWLKSLTNKRMHLIYNLQSKTHVARRILEKLQPHERVLVFCGSIEQAEKLCGTQVYHSKSGDQALVDFKAGKINRLGVVKAVDEAHNIPNLDVIVVVQANSVDRSFIQRLGRALRFRPGYKARVFLLGTENTVDMKWIDSAMEEIDKSKVSHYSSLKLIDAA